jgi:probable HAF family extracellular repeat protein
MKTCATFCVSVFILCVGSVDLVLASAYAYTTIDFPGATLTALGGVNDLGQIVGGYELSDGTRHGFLYSGGMFSTIDDPNATSGTELVGINSLGQIVGSYDFTDPNHLFEGAHGFLYDSGTFTPLDFPSIGVTSTTPNGINDSGTVVGLYRMSGPGNGFVYSGGSYSTLNFPGMSVVGTHLNGINNAGAIVGQYRDFDGGPHHGFLDNGGTFTTIDFPGATDTVAQSIDNFGNIVGNASTANAMFGFIDQGGAFTEIAFPDALYTVIGGFNDQGDIVGFYEDQSMVLHGFEAAPVPEPGTLVLFVLGVVGAGVMSGRFRAAI